MEQSPYVVSEDGTGSIIAETLVPAIMLFVVKDRITISQILRKNWKSLLAAAIMFVVVYCTSIFMTSSIIHTVILIVEGIVVYITVAFAIKCTIAYEALAIVKNKIRHN